MSFLGELKRRKIFQVAAVYAVVAWLLIQIVATISPMINLPDWTGRLVLVLLATGFPITLIMSWGFNLTPEGIVREDSTNEGNSKSGFKIEYVLLGAVVIALIWLVYRVEFDSGERSIGLRDGVLPNSVAVLPFYNLSLDPDDAFFADGIHESTLNQLAKIGDLTVIARTSVLPYADKPKPIPEIARELNVESVLEGSVRYAAGRVLITAQLIDGNNGAHLWSDEYNRELTDIFAVQADVARHIAVALQAELLPEEQARIDSRPTESEEAYQFYLHALSYPDLLYYPEHIPARIEALQKAIDLDPEFSDAYVEMSSTLYWARERDRSLVYARKAIELDSTAAGAYHNIKMILRYYYRKLDEARWAVEKAIEHGSGESEYLFQHAVWLIEVEGDYEEAIQYGNRAIAIDPFHIGSLFWVGYIHLRASQFDKAKRYLEEAIRLRPSEINAYWMLANVEYLLGNRAAAKANLDKTIQMTAHMYTDRLGYIAYLYGLLGEKDLAAEVTARLRDSRSRQTESFGYLRWAALGTRDKEQALQAWEDVIHGYLEEDKPVSTGTISRFRDNWLNDPLLNEPEFLKLRRRLEF